jgi:outer membrane protein OmpA-like peptidoglycan-associated protein
MKNILIILFAALPFFIVAQNDNSFFDHTTIKIEKTQINTTNSDFGPSFVNNELWYSAFTEAEIKKLSRGVTKNVFYNLFVTPIDSEGNILNGKQIVLEEISEDYHAGPVSYCPATKELFVTLSNFEDPDIKNKVYQKAQIRLKIIILKEVNDEWKVVEELPFNNRAYSVGHPTISTTGDTLFFSSKIPDFGSGLTDLYMAIRENGEWGELKNLEKLNTSGDEMFPFLYDNNMLIFSSNGRKENGKDLDLYYTYLTNDGFTEPLSLDEFNTSSDDFGLIIHPKGEVGYFNSRKTGGLGSDDIYKVTFEKGYYNLELLVRDKISLEPMPNAAVKFSDNLTLTTNINGIIKRDLDYDTEYQAISEIENYMNASVTFTTVNMPYGELKEIIDVEKVVIGQKFTLENIFYDFDKWDILPESEIELDKLVKVMNDNPSWKVELGSHTDCRGSDPYNEVLSQKRSDSAVDYIISAGIFEDRIIAKGYGETMLVNHCDDGVSCSAAEHRANRRTEFKILEMGNK